MGWVGELHRQTAALPSSCPTPQGAPLVLTNLRADYSPTIQLSNSPGSTTIAHQLALPLRRTPLSVPSRLQLGCAAGHLPAKVHQGGPPEVGGGPRAGDRICAALGTGRRSSGQARWHTTSPAASLLQNFAVCRSQAGMTALPMLGG